MRLHYYRTIPNFGDVLNTSFWPKVFGNDWSTRFEGDPRLIGIGTLLQQSLDSPETLNLVAGAGFGYGKPPAFAGEWYVAFVRGPLTAAHLGLPTTLAATDPAYLVDEILGLDICASNKRNGTLFIPHCENDKIYQWPMIAKLANVTYLSPAESPELVIEAIRTAKLVITESMHGAIIADSLRVPWVPIRIGDNINDFKWRDFCTTVDVEHRFEILAPPRVGRKIFFRPSELLTAGRRLRDLKNYQPRLSSQTSSDRAKTRLKNEIARLREAPDGGWKDYFFRINR